MASAEMMDLQPELEWYMLPFLVDFMIEVHSQFRMSPYTLHLAINLINRYVSKRVVFKKHYQLVGCAALWIAAKFTGRSRPPGRSPRLAGLADRGVTIGSGRASMPI